MTTRAAAIRLARGIRDKGLGRVLLACALAGWPVAAATVPAADPIAATWRTERVAIDGSSAGWSGFTRVGNGPLIAVQNDAGSLSLVVLSNDDTVRRQLATGLVVWLEGSGRTAPTFGLRLEGLTRPPLPGATPDASRNVDAAKGSSFRVLDAFDLLASDKRYRRLIDRPGEVAIALASGVEDGWMVYELEVPLTRTDATPFAVGASAGATIALGLETPAEPKRPRDPNDPEDRMPVNPWLSDPYYGGFFNPPPPTYSSDKASAPKPLKPLKLVWATVRLADAPAP